MAGNYNPKSAAARVGISTTTLRNYCSPAMFAEFLSPEATPPAGIERRLTDNDLAIFQRVTELRSQGMTTDAIKQTLQAEDLSAMQPPYINAEIIVASPTEPTEAPQPAPLATVSADVFTAALHSLQSQHSQMQVQIEAIRTEQAQRFTWFVWGHSLESWLY